MNELKNRGIQYILIAVVDGLKGFPEAITATFPRHLDQHLEPVNGARSRRHGVSQFGCRSSHFSVLIADYSC